MKSFTLIETMVVITVFTLIFGAVSAFIVTAYRTQEYTLQQSVAINEARRGIETMVKEIREAVHGEDGSYPIVLAADKEFIFFSDIDKDGETERVRYFLGNAGSGSQTKECSTSTRGGSCSAVFSDFLRGSLISAAVKVSADGDLGLSNEYAEIFTDGNLLDKVCQTGCSDCPGAWQGTKNFTVSDWAQDDSLSFSAYASSRVDPVCPHAMKAKFEFSWEEELAGSAHEFKKGVIEPLGDPPTYPSEQEQVTILSSYVRNVPPIFRYFDSQGNELTDLPARLQDTKIMDLFLIINVNSNRPPQDFELKSSVQLRNLKDE